MGICNQCLPAQKSGNYGEIWSITIAVRNYRKQGFFDKKNYAAFGPLSVQSFLLQTSHVPSQGSI